MSTQASRQDTLYHDRIALQQMHDGRGRAGRAEAPNHILSKYKSSDYPASFLSSAKSKKMPILNQQAAKFYENPKNKDNFLNKSREKKVHLVKPLKGLQKQHWHNDRVKVKAHKPIGVQGSFFGLPNK